MNVKIYTLDNNLKVILNQDNKKHMTKAILFINAGGLTNEYYINEKKYVIPYGIAHFLEHYLLEQSRYGNIVDIFDREYIGNNGRTSNLRTNYYISTVHDFKDNFIKFLNVINNPIFDDDRIDLVKKPIISEINRKNDQKYVKYMKQIYTNLFENDVYDKTLGDIKTINNIKKEDLINFYNAFYQPSNQLLFITGNFEDDIIDLVNELYKSYKRPYSKIEFKKIIEDKKVINKESICKNYINEDICNLSYKISTKDLTPIEKNKLDYYFAYIYDSNFSENSELFDYIISNNLSRYNIHFSYEPFLLKDFVVISFEVYTNKFDEVINLIKNRLENLKLDESEFNHWKNKQIIENINNTENSEWVTNNMIDNILFYDLYQFDNIEFIKDTSLDEFKKLLKKIDLTNYSITKNVCDN